VKRRLEAWAAAGVTLVLRGLPRRAAMGLGAIVGRMLAAADRRHVAIAVDNLRRAFPDWDGARLEATARGVYAHFGRMLFDILWLQSRSPKDLLALVDVHGREHLEAAMAAGRGVVMCAAHIGNWEVHGIAHGLLFGAIDVVARPLDNPVLDARLCAFRTMGGNRVVYKRRALAQVIGAVRAGRGVALLLDQNVQAKDGIFVDFFGRPAATTTVAAALALKTGCALVPSHTELRPDGRYALVYEPPLVLPSDGARDADLASITQELARRAEAWVRATPEQWLWMHRRWKTQPERQG
jgi:Kdo2-lipid IVA lauroyltransferase/acyltransferase